MSLGMWRGSGCRQRLEMVGCRCCRRLRITVPSRVWTANSPRWRRFVNSMPATGCRWVGCWSRWPRPVVGDPRRPRSSRSCTTSPRTIRSVAARSSCRPPDRGRGSYRLGRRRQFWMRVDTCAIGCCSR